MATPKATDRLVERLRRTKPVAGRPYKSDAVEPINPDGPAAADEITALKAEIARLREAVWLARQPSGTCGSPTPSRRP